MKPAKAGNSGIQATTVTAEVIAVGTGASASKAIHSEPAEASMSPLIAELRRSLSQLPLQQAAKDALEEDVVKLHEAAKSKEAPGQKVEGVLSSMVGKLKMVGVLLSDAAAVAEPIKKIAELFGLSFA